VLPSICGGLACEKEPFLPGLAGTKWLPGSSVIPNRAESCTLPRTARLLGAAMDHGANTLYPTATDLPEGVAMGESLDELYGYVCLINCRNFMDEFQIPLGSLNAN